MPEGRIQMLQFYTGMAGTGKTSAVMNEIKKYADLGVKGQMLFVPDQYSHEAERELCEKCGNGISLYAEVNTFSSFSKNILSNSKKFKPLIDKGGRLLSMTVALSGIYSYLKVYGNAIRYPENMLSIIKEIDVLKQAAVTPELLSETAANCEGQLSLKLSDLSLIMEAYNAVISNGYADPSDMLDLLATEIEGMDSWKNVKIYFDGFIDLTEQQLNIISILMSKGADITVCLNSDGSNSEIFEPARKIQSRLEKLADETDVEVNTKIFEDVVGKNEMLQVFNKYMFSYTASQYDNNNDIGLFCSNTVSEECEFAASECIRLVRDGGARWKDIAIAVRGFDDYSALLENIFNHYEVPVYLTRKTDMLSRSLPSMISDLFEIIDGGWETDTIISYLRTGLTGLEDEEIDDLENYIIKWPMGENDWKSEDKWVRHPSGYGFEYTEEDWQQINRINCIKKKVADPLMKFEESCMRSVKAVDKADALIDFMRNIELRKTIEKRAEMLKNNGQETKAEEYKQLWELLVNAIEQAVAILNVTEMDTGTFGKLLKVVLSQYEIGTIPISLDRVSAGDFDRMRRRNIKHLIVLGASNERLPRNQIDRGLFTDSEITEIQENGIKINGNSESAIYKELALVYNTMTLPKESLKMSYSVYSGEEKQTESYLMTKASRMFGIEIQQIDINKSRVNARKPLKELAACGFHNGRKYALEANRYLKENREDEYSKLKMASEYSRGELSRESVEQLYGKNIHMSASRVESHSRCEFAYFMQYGLSAKKRKASGMTAPEVGTFVHYILQHVAEEIKNSEGFKTVSKERVSELTDKYAEKYIKEVMNGFANQTSRFKYLFNRVCSDTRVIVMDMVDEFKNSDFEPLDFEFDFGKDSRTKNIKISEDGDFVLELTGIADRVDGWKNDNKLYIRVVDYKTGTKTFTLSDVCYGLNMQLLLYLYVFKKYGKDIYGEDVVPAGVLYVPARTKNVQNEKNIDKDKVESERLSSIKRSGLILNSNEVINAMENTDEHIYLPIKLKKDGMPDRNSTKNLADENRFENLMKYIETNLEKLSEEMFKGEIKAFPYYKSSTDNACVYCDFKDACFFGESMGEQTNYIRKMDVEDAWEIISGGDSNG